MRHKVLLLDIDGTIVPIVKNYKGILSPRVKQAIRSLTDRGIPVSLATGRSLKHARPLMETLGITLPCIIGNGGALYNPSTKTLVRTYPLERAQVERILRVAENNAVLHIAAVLAEDEFFWKPEMIRDEILCLWLHFDGSSEKRLDEVVRELRNDSRLSVQKITKTWGSELLLGVTHVTATKQNAIATLMRYLKVKPEDVIAVGDSENDLPMLLAAGIGVAMGNAPDSLKSIAQDIAPPVDQDGLVAVIEKYYGAV